MAPSRAGRNKTTRAGLDEALCREATEECRDRTRIPEDVTKSLSIASCAATARRTPRLSVRPWSTSATYLPSWNGRTYEAQTNTDAGAVGMSSHAALSAYGRLTRSLSGIGSLEARINNLRALPGLQVVDSWLQTSYSRQAPSDPRIIETRTGTAMTVGRLAVALPRREHGEDGEARRRRS